MTALIVPVASTTSSISPCSTFAVKCCPWLPRFRPNAATIPITTIKPIRTSHLFFVFIQFSSKSMSACLLVSSFVSQRLDGIESRCFACRVIAEEHAHGNRENRRNRYGFKRHLRLPMQRLANHIRSENSKEHTGCATHQAQHDCFPEKLKLDGLFRSADRHANSNFARALRDGHQHHVHNPDSPH